MVRIATDLFHSADGVSRFLISQFIDNFFDVLVKIVFFVCTTFATN